MMMVVELMLMRVVLMLLILLCEIYDLGVISSMYDNMIFFLLTVHDYFPLSKYYSSFSRIYLPYLGET